MRLVNHRVAEFVALIAELEHGAAKRGAFGHAEAFCKAACGFVAHNNLKRNNLYLFDERFPVAELLFKMSGNSFAFKQFEQIIGHFIVDDAFAGDGSLFQAVKGRCVVLVIYNAEVFVVGCKHFFCLAFVKLFFLFQGFSLQK